MAELIVLKLAVKLLKEGVSAINLDIPSLAIPFVSIDFPVEFLSVFLWLGLLSSLVNGLLPILVGFSVGGTGLTESLLLFSASILLIAIGLAPTVLAKLIASVSAISLGCPSGVLTPNIPSSMSLFIKNFTSFTIPGKSSEKVSSVETTIFSLLSRAIPLLLVDNWVLIPEMSSSWILIVYPKNFSAKFPKRSVGSTSWILVCLWKAISSAIVSNPLCLFLNLSKV